MDSINRGPLYESYTTFDKGIDAMTHTQQRSSAADRQVSEQQAIAHLKQGSLAGLAVLVQIYQVEAVHVALLIVRDLGTAEEIVQEAFLKVYQKIDQFDDRRPFGPWFFRSVIHAALKVASRQNRIEPLEEPQDGSRVAQWWIDPGLGPPEMVENAEMRASVWQALGQLTPNQRTAVVLRYFLEESESEMIQELDRPLTTVKWWLHTARQRLRKILGPLHTAKTKRQEVDHESE